MTDVLINEEAAFSIISFFTWKAFGIFCVTLNAVLGIMLVENALKNSKRFMECPEEIDEMFPAFRRHDSKKWSRWNLYPGAMTILIPRITSSVFFIAIMGLCCSILTIGHDYKDPIVGLRRIGINNVVYFCVGGMSLISFWGLLKHEEISDDDPKVDYTEYLGPNYKKELKEHRESG